MAISPMAMTFRIADARRDGETEPAPPDFIASDRSRRDARQAGPRPNNSAATAAAPAANSRTPPSSEIPSNPTRVSPAESPRGKTIRRSGIIDAATVTRPYATTSPAAALASDSSRLSVISCRTMRQRLAPSASRIATSR